MKLFKLSIFAALLTATSAFAGNIADDFNSNSYSHSSGSVAWSGPWVEFADSNQDPFSNPDTGEIQLNSDGLFFGGESGFGGVPLTYEKNIVRQFNLEGKEDVIIAIDISENKLNLGGQGTYKLTMEI